MTIIDVWINCPDRESAQLISTTLIEERLAAAANLFAGIQSTFHWKGNVEHTSEVPLLLKTRSDLFQMICGRVEELHPYETPGIIGVEIRYLNSKYKDWIIGETRP